MHIVFCLLLTILYCIVLRDPGLSYFGLQNVLLPVGTSFLEIISPIKKNVTADRYINKFGDGGYMIIIQLKDANELKQAEQNAKDIGVRIVHKSARSIDGKDTGIAAHGKGVGIDKPGIAGIHLHPNDVGCVAEVTNMIPSNKWLWADQKWETYEEQERISKSNIVGFGGVTIAVDDPKKKCLVWKKLLGLESDRDDDVIVLRDYTTIKFVKKVDERDNGVIGIDVYSRDADCTYSKEICGVRFTFIPFKAKMRSKL